MNSNSDLDYFVSRLNRETNLPELIVINNSFMSRLEINGDIYVEVLNDDFRVTYKSTSISFTFTQDAIDFVLNIAEGKLKIYE